MPTDTPDAALAETAPEAETAGSTAGHASDGWTALGLGVGFLLLYLRTLCPTVYMGDSGEICTAIATGGVIHPPGYPLFSVLGRAALALVPVGEPAFRIGCLVAFAAAAAVGGLYLLAREIGAAPWAASLAAAALGVSHTVWSQSTRVEVYTLHMLLVCMALWSALRYRRTGSGWSLAAATLAMSLGLAHHLTIALLAPAWLILIGPRFWAARGRARRIISGVPLVLAGPALYVLLVVWARTEPLHAWGNTVDVPLLWNHASARCYQNLLALPDGPRLLESLRRAGLLFGQTFPSLSFLLPGVGVWFLWRRDRGAAAALLLTFGLIFGYCCCYRIGDIAPYFLPAWIVAAALLAVALDAARGLLRTPPARAALAAGLGVLLVGLPLLGNWSACDLSRAIWVREFARHKLENADPGCVLITAHDNDTFPLWYVREVLNVRQDVFPIDRVALNGSWSGFEREPSLWYLHRLRRQGLQLPLEVPSDRSTFRSLGQDGYLIRLLTRELRGRPIAVTFFATSAPEATDHRVFFRWAAARYHQLPLGLLLRLQPRNRPVDLQRLLNENEQRWQSMSLPDFRGVRIDEEANPDYISDHYACSLLNFGNLYQMAGDTDRATAIYRRAAEWAPHYPAVKEALEALRVRPRVQTRRPAPHAEDESSESSQPGRPAPRVLPEGSPA